jgi:nucleoside-diphosphate-sugar epimerase
MPSADFIVHCAASGRGGAEAYQHVYVDGCRNLTERFPGVPLLFTSSTSVYAQTDGSVVTEESPAIPERETGRLLLEAENITIAAGGIVARLSGIYGPGRSVILKKFLSGEAVIEEDGRRFLNQIHRDDAARAVLHLATTRATGVFNVSDSTPLSQLAVLSGAERKFFPSAATFRPARSEPQARLDAQAGFQRQTPRHRLAAGVSVVSRCGGGDRETCP